MNEDEGPNYVYPRASGEASAKKRISHAYRSYHDHRSAPSVARAHGVIHRGPRGICLCYAVRPARRHARRASEGGLHAKLPWPVQSVQRLDRRLQYFDLPETELLTHDATGQTIDKTLTVVAYVCWKIPDTDSVDWFIRRVGQPERARAILGEASAASSALPSAG